MLDNNYNSEVLQQLLPQKVRELIREGRLREPTAKMATRYTKGTLIVIPKSEAYDFLVYTQRNSKACPVLEVSDAGSKEFRLTAPGSDITRDISRYSIYGRGELVGEADSLERYWRPDLVSFLLGCSRSFEAVLQFAGVQLRHVDDGYDIPLFITNIKTIPSGHLSSPLVVSMRPIKRQDLMKTMKITSLLEDIHGAPIHIGDPELIGIKDLRAPDFGAPLLLAEDEVPVFWASSITAKLALIRNRSEFLITQAPGHDFITDILSADLSSLME